MEPADQERRTVLLAISGDTAAFGALVRRHQAWVRSLLRRSCGDAALAEDLAQATFLQAWRQLHSLRDPDAFRAWLRRIAINRLVDAVRRRTIVTESFADEAPHEHGPAPDVDIVARIDLDHALGRIGLAQRTCIVLAYGEGMSHGEIAASLDIPLGTVKSHIARGIVALRTFMVVEDD